jgi:hypothetical protein
MPKANKWGCYGDNELPEVSRLEDGRLIWICERRDGGFDTFLLEGSHWVRARGITVRELLDSDTLSEEEIRDLIASGAFQRTA